MFTKPICRRPAERILGAAAALIPLAVILVVIVQRAPDTPRASADQRPPVNETEPLDREVRQAGADESWWQAVSAQLEREEYAATPAPQGFQAPNRAHNLRTTFGERGIEVVPRTNKGVSPAWRFAWETSAFGRQGHMEEVGPVSPESAGDRVTYRREGWSEWYENTASGLEQGFTIERRPAGEGPLQIAGKVPDAMRPERRADGAIDFMESHGACAIRYGELHTWDAEGTELSAELMVAGDGLAIVIDDQDAEYPLTVDPLMTSPAWTAEGISNTPASASRWRRRGT